MENLQDVLYTIFLRNPQNLFDEFIIECQKWYEVPAHTFTEMRTRANKKIRGDLFEEFCVLYLKYVKRYPHVWLLKDVPEDILQKLSLKRRDMGIDIIARITGDVRLCLPHMVENIEITGLEDPKEESTYIAIQCKYKKTYK